MTQRSPGRARWASQRAVERRAALERLSWAQTTGLTPYHRHPGEPTPRQLVDWARALDRLQVELGRSSWPW